ncbi:MAG: GNAT family N-acetyltransferase [Patescibacteria group bacterium UBA2103]
MEILTNLPKERFLEYKNLKLESIKSDPLAFSATEEELLKRTDEDWQKDLNDKHRIFFFAEENGELVGMASTQLYVKDRFKHLAFLYSLYVKESQRGKGVATLLIQKREEVLKQKGVTQVVCEIYGTQIPSIQLHEKLGYKEAGRIPNFSCTEDGCVDKITFYKAI